MSKLYTILRDHFWDEFWDSRRVQLAVYTVFHEDSESEVKNQKFTASRENMGNTSKNIRFKFTIKQYFHISVCFFGRRKASAVVLVDTYHSYNDENLEGCCRWVLETI